MWISPDAQTRNQIDFVMSEWRWEKSITKCNTYPRADCDSDHQLLVARIKIKLVNKKEQKTNRFNMEMIAGEKKQEYACAVRNRFECLSETAESIDDKWQLLKTVMLESVREVAGSKMPVKSKRWISDKTIKLAAKKKAVRLKNPEITRSEILSAKKCERRQTQID